MFKLFIISSPLHFTILYFCGKKTVSIVLPSAWLNALRVASLAHPESPRSNLYIVTFETPDFSDKSATLQPFFSL